MHQRDMEKWPTILNYLKILQLRLEELEQKSSKGTGLTGQEQLEIAVNKVAIDFLQENLKQIMENILRWKTID